MCPHSPDITNFQYDHIMNHKELKWTREQTKRTFHWLALHQRVYFLDYFSFQGRQNARSSCGQMARSFNTYVHFSFHNMHAFFLFKTWYLVTLRWSLPRRREIARGTWIEDPNADSECPSCYKTLHSPFFEYLWDVLAVSSHKTKESHKSINRNNETGEAYASWKRRAVGSAFVTDF